MLPHRLPPAPGRRQLGAAIHRPAPRVIGNHSLGGRPPDGRTDHETRVIGNHSRCGRPPDGRTEVLRATCPRPVPDESPRQAKPVIPSRTRNARRSTVACEGSLSNAERRRERVLRRHRRPFAVCAMRKAHPAAAGEPSPKVSRAGTPQARMCANFGGYGGRPSPPPPAPRVPGSPTLRERGVP